MNRTLESAFNIFKDDLLKLGDELLEHVHTSRENTIYCLVCHSLDNSLYLCRISNHPAEHLEYWERLNSEHLGILINRVPITQEEWVQEDRDRKRKKTLAIVHTKSHVPIAVREAMKANSS